VPPKKERGKKKKRWIIKTQRLLEQNIGKNLYDQVRQRFPI
jgi:hypothetical protein